jgi:hypothetical protein
MCYFITAILASDVDTAGIVAITAVFRAHGRACQPYVNTALAVQIGDAERSYYTTIGHCDCGTPLGSAAVAAASSGGDDDVDRKAADAHQAHAIEAARLRRKGWSEAKIARALTQRDEAQARPRRRREEPTQTSLDQWCALIRETLATSRIAFVGLLLHDYRGSINDEDIALKGRQTFRANDLNETALAAMREDTICEFRR